MQPVSPYGWRFILARYVPLFGVTSLVWEIGQFPLYTIGQQKERAAQIFAILHCTAGDLVVGVLSLALATTLFARRGRPSAAHLRVLSAATLLGIIYTILSE